MKLPLAISLVSLGLGIASLVVSLVRTPEPRVITRTETVYPPGHLLGQDHTAARYHRPPIETDEPRASKYGYVSIKSVPELTSVFIDGKPIGFAPVMYHKVRAGKRRIEVIGTHSRKVLDVIVSPRASREDPLKIIVKL